VNPVVFHPEAEAEYNAAIAYYEGQRAGLGLALQAIVQAALTLIQKNPKIYAKRGGTEIRKCVLQRFPYNIFYEELDDSVWIAAVAHHRRRPGYWTHRTPN
jgi:toxin ParE1/3/4